MFACLLFIFLMLTLPNPQSLSRRIIFCFLSTSTDRCASRVSVCCAANGIGDAGAQALAAALKKNRTLTSLVVAGVFFRRFYFFGK
jgi:hypothetical protein